METLTEQRYNALRTQAERAQREADRAAGAKEALLKRLKEEFNCNTIAEARRLLDKLAAQASEVETKLNKAMAEYERAWKGDDA